MSPPSILCGLVACVFTPVLWLMAVAVWSRWAAMVFRVLASGVACPAASLFGGCVRLAVLSSLSVGFRWLQGCPFWFFAARFLPVG